MMKVITSTHKDALFVMQGIMIDCALHGPLIYIVFQLPNEMFYDDELEACADKLKRESLCNWSRLPSKGFPIIFEGIKGRDMREEKSPSFFNPEEAAMVVQYVKDLKDARGISVLPSQIGIISPYRKQVQSHLSRKYLNLLKTSDGIKKYSPPLSIGE